MGGSFTVRLSLRCFRSSGTATKPVSTILRSHALDLPFHFGTLDVDVWREFAGATGADAEDADRLSEHLRQAWAQFAATGVPGCPSIGDWPTYVGNNRTAAASGGEHAGAPCNIGDDLRERSNLVTETGRNIRAAPDLNGSRYAAWRS